MRKFIGLSGLVLGLLFGVPALAQTNVNPVTTLPNAVSGGNSEVDGTIGSTNVWQLVFASVKFPSVRTGCLIQNTSTDLQRVAFVAPVGGTTTAPTSTTAGFPIAVAAGTGQPGGWINCATGAGASLQDAIYILGTSGDTFRAQQE